MKLRSLNATAPLMVLMGALAACGGGGDDEAGSLTVFSVAPSTYTQTARTTENGGPAAGLCEASGNTPLGPFFIYGGAAPYRLDNTGDDRVRLSTTRVSDRGGSFTVEFSQVCFTGRAIVIVDKLDRQITLTLNNSPA
ncbi:MAG: hypothetical protein V4750_00085 [Pseudomonadota bacterium]